MFELFFVINLPKSVVREYFPDEFTTQKQCESAGEQYARDLMEQVIEKYPNLRGFDIDCVQRSKSPDRVNS